MPKRARIDATATERAAMPIPAYIPQRYWNRFRAIRSFHFHPTRYLDADTLTEYGMQDTIATWLQRIGWTRVAAVRHSTYVQPCIDFLATCTDFDTQDAGRAEDLRVRFHMSGAYYDISLAEFNVRLGFHTEETVQTPAYTDAYLDIPQEWKDGAVWAELTGEAPGDYDPRQSKASRLTNPILRAVHRWISGSVHGRSSSEGVVSRSDLFILWCMTHGEGHPCNPGLMFLRTCINVGRKLSGHNSGHVVFGSFISKLATSLGHHPTPDTTIIQMSAIGLSTLVAIHAIRRVAPGQYILDETGAAVDQAQHAEDARQQMAVQEAAVDPTSPPPSPPPADHPAPPPPPSQQDVLARVDQLEFQLHTQFDGINHRLDALQETQSTQYASISSFMEQLQMHLPPPPSLQDVLARIDQLKFQLQTQHQNYQERFDRIDHRLDALQETQSMQYASILSFMEQLQTHFPLPPPQ